MTAQLLDLSHGIETGMFTHPGLPGRARRGIGTWPVHAYALVPDITNRRDT
jgi:hypothetical protein